MSNHTTNQVVQQLFRQVCRFARSLTRGAVLWLMRVLFILSRRRSPQGPQGFVLPTVVMVAIVVVLLTGAMIYRSYDRSRNATNVRVDQAVLNSGAPAIDRARAKLAAMFQDPSLPQRGTPNDLLLQEVLAKEDYTFADEIRLKMVADFTTAGGGTNQGDNTFGQNANPFTASGAGRIPNPAYTIINDESSINAWKFPVDTDSNGKFDSYTLYAISFRLPKRNNSGEFERSRSTLDARTPPMEAPGSTGRCASSAGAASVTGADWYSNNNRQTKAFFTYSATVPIAAGDPVLADTNRYEPFRGQVGFSALEVQQDFSRIALNNNAVVFEDDLSLSSGPPLRISGRIFTNSNLFLRGAGGSLDLYQVSSPASCFYQEENSKIVVGGNVKKGVPGTDPAPVASNLAGRNDPGVHLFRVPGNNPGLNDVDQTITFTDADRSVNETTTDMSFNSLAYNERLALLVTAATTDTVQNKDNDPEEVTSTVATLMKADPSLSEAQARTEAYQVYFRNRTRRVPTKEVAFGTGNALANPVGGNYTVATVLQGANPTAGAGPQNQLRPPTAWMFPLNYFTNDPTGFTGLTLRTTGPSATNPVTLQADPVKKEQRVGDRLLVGNNLPALWYQCDDGTLTCTNGRFVGNTVEQPVYTALNTPQAWADGGQRTRRTQAVKLDELDTIARDGLWERSAAVMPQDEFDNSGGVRIITGAGIYERKNSFLPPPPDLAQVGRPSVLDNALTDVASGATGGDGNPFPYTIQEDKLPVVWPDTLPMAPGVQVYDNTAAAGTNPTVDLASVTTPLIDLKALTTTLATVTNPLGTITGTTASAPTVDPFTPKYAKGDLRMRSTVVYHYRRDASNPDAFSASPSEASLRDAYQVPIACISSYYDPTSPETARNALGLPDVSGGFDTVGARSSPTGVLPNTTIGDGTIDQNLYGRPLNDPVLGGFDQGANAGKSNNGVVYSIDPTTDLTAATFAINHPIPAAALPDTVGNDGLFQNGTEGGANENSTTLLGKLYYQANLVYPNSRFVNEPLREALYALGKDAERKLSLSEQAAIDSALCSLRILGDSTVSATPPTPAATPVLPHGSIREVTLLDPRQPKAVDGRFIRVASAEATASSGTGSAATYTITYRIPPEFRPNWNGLPNLTADDATPTDTKLAEIFDANDVVTIQGFEAINPRLNVNRGTVSGINEANNTITVMARGTNAAAISLTAAPKDTAGITETLTAELDMPLEDRQPSEVRITQIDLNLLRTTELASTDPSAPREFMIPNSGIIYVSRDSALQDLSNTSPDVTSKQLLSSSDYRLDPTRRLAGVMLINGNRIDRVNAQRDAEKGLIVATNLKGYVQADTRIEGGAALGHFNLHADPTTRNLQEEFTNILDADWADFYTRTVAQINPQFACRSGAPNCNTGDSWRSAVLLADTFSPLSRNYRMGYRSDGDFDLNNNQDTWLSRAKRLKNGFFTNDFAVNGLSGVSRTNAAPFTDVSYGTATADIVNSSYFNNYVTPVQRRSQEPVASKGFPEYVMEICRKLPVSECQPQDWVVGYDADGNGVITNDARKTNARDLPIGYDRTRLVAGTTALPPIDPGDRRFSRRIAFARNDYGALVLDLIGTTGRATAKPLGIGCDAAGTIVDGCTYPAPGDTPTAGTHYGTPIANALWYRTTSNRDGRPGKLDELAPYSGNTPLYYMDPAQGGLPISLPETACFNTATKTITPCGTTAIANVVNLNLPIATKASSYSVCGTADQSQAYRVVPPLTGGACPAAAAIATNYTLLNGLAADVTVPAGPLGDQTFTGTGQVIVVDLSQVTAITPGSILTLSGTPDTVFVLKANNLVIGADAGAGVKMVLDQVDPNQVLWVGNGFDIKNAEVAAPHQLVGTFIGNNTPAPLLGINTRIEGGRFLGYQAMTAVAAPTAPDQPPALIAITTTGQPSLVPVLQYTALRDDTDNAIQPSNAAWQGVDDNNTDTNGNNRWRQSVQLGATQAQGESYNLIIAVGNNPGRVFTNGGATIVEGDGGIGNFPRFLESWDNTPLKINGGLIQIKRAIFATASDRTVLNSGNQTNPANWTTFGYFQAYKTCNGSLIANDCGGSNSWGVNATYTPPERLFGFDPGILSQLPDLFTEQFAIPEPTRNEFFRQLNRSDPWVQALLCSAQPGETNQLAGISANPAVEPDVTRRRNYSRRVGVPTAETGDIDFTVPAIPLSNPLRPNNSDYCVNNLGQVPKTCFANGTGPCN